jgi:hypothetical protein
VTSPLKPRLGRGFLYENDLSAPTRRLASMGRDLTLAPGMGGANAQTIPTNAFPPAPGSVHPSTRRKAYDDGLPPPARSAKARPGIRFNEHIEGDGPTVFAHACKLGLEGISSWDKLS